MKKSRNIYIKVLSLFVGVMMLFSIIEINTLSVKGKNSSYSIVFNTNGGKGKMTKQTITYNTFAYIKKCSFTKKGYTFLGWSKTKKGKISYKNRQKIRNICKAGSRLTLYAQWKKDSNRRAILLGETSTIEVPINDVKSMNGVMKNSIYHGLKMSSVVYYPNHKKKDIVAKIKSVFKYNKPNDVSYIYMTCHGDEYGNVYIGSDDTYFSVSGLRKLLDRYVNGKVVLIIDSCYSGRMIKNTMINTTDNSDFADKFVNDFINYENTEIKGFTTNKYVVLCSSKANETSRGGDDVSLATRYWSMGAGWHPVQKKTCKLFADTDGNGRVTLKELYKYSYNNVKKQGQHVVAYPKNSSFVLFGRFN